jgi:tetratricopeptide (TPR) repeat protein
MLMVHSSRFSLAVTGLVIGSALVGVAGCSTDEALGPQREPAAVSGAQNSPEPTAAPVPLAGRSEADLVRELTLHRSLYVRYVQAMATFYAEHGYEQKAAWARNELRSFQNVKQGNYLSDAEATANPADNSAGTDGSPINLVDTNELDLVESMIEHRRMYTESLRVLTAYYTENGDDKKANVARLELKGLQSAKQYKYVMSAEMPLASLRPTESIAEADKMYNDAMKLLDKGGHHVAIWFNRQTMNKALAILKDLIARYPNSDKIDDAAYYIGEIYKEYGEEKDNLLAIEWYKLAIEWNPQLPHPAWSHCAHILDFRLHEREQALEWYNKVLENEKDQTGPRSWRNVAAANKRIKELTDEKTRYAPGETVPEPQPEQPAK